jgi:hypothetical protein
MFGEYKVNPLHEFGDGFFAGLNHQVIVVIHDRPGEAFKGILFLGDRDLFEQEFFHFLTGECFEFRDAGGSDLVEGVRDDHSWFSRHESSLALQVLIRMIIQSGKKSSKNRGCFKSQIYLWGSLTRR